MKHFALMFALLLVPSIVSAEVQARDDVAVTGDAVMLAARTKGLILPRGGELVEFVVNGKSLGENLSGGDGWAYREFVPKREGLYTIEVVSGEETGEGHLLALKEGRRIVFVDVQAALAEPPFSRAPIVGSREALERISKKFPIVYLSTDLPPMVIKKWLKENGFPASPLLEWRGGGVFDNAVEKGLNVKAVIGGASVIRSALKYEGAELFTFGQSDEATEVDSWEDVEKSLK